MIKISKEDNKLVKKQIDHQVWNKVRDQIAKQFISLENWSSYEFYIRTQDTMVWRITDSILQHLNSEL